MRLLSAELLALRKRAATYVVLGVLLAVMALIYVVVGISSEVGGDDIGSSFLRFPNAYAGLAQLVFGLGSLLAVVYSAAIAGGDWNWGIPRLILSRGESRVLYVLAKAVAVAIVLAVGVLVALAAGIVLVYLAAGLAGVRVGDPIGGQSMATLLESLLLGYPVLLERAAIAFAVATLLRSQLAGIVVGIVLYIGEGILSAILLSLAIAGRGLLELEPFGPEWYQFLPFSVGDSVLTNIGTGNGGGGGGVDGGFEGLFLRPVPLEVALVAVALYLVAAVVVSVASVWRSEITS